MSNKNLKENNFLLQEYQKNPELFKTPTYTDNSDFLEKIGIFLPQNLQKSLSSGYIKLWMEDFLVEEVQEDGTLAGLTLAENQQPFAKTIPPLSPCTLYATLVKCGLSTIEAIEELSNLLKTKKENIHFGGIKDKLAITSQKISLRKISLEQLNDIFSPNFFLKDIQIGKGVMEIGKIKGNKFTILVRTGRDFNKELFEKNLETINQKGFYKFFYAQRFGSPRFINWWWGLLILKGDYRNAVYSFLAEPGLRELPYFKNLREKIGQNLDNWPAIEKILEPLASFFPVEIKIVKYLVSHPRDFVGALKQAPEQTQLWVFAYASLLFNRKLSFFIQQKSAPPQKLPLLLSPDKNDWLEYFDLLKEDQIFRLPLDNLKPFKFIHFKRRFQETKILPEFHQYQFTPEGVILSFSLPKGAYATTYLAHLFKLISGTPPSDISFNKINIKKAMGEKCFEKILERFQHILKTESQNIIEKIKEE